MKIVRKRVLLVLIFITILGWLYPVNYGKNKVTSKKINWSVIESRHFDIYYLEGEDDFGKLVVLMAENAYYYLNSFFQRPLNRRIPIIVYSSKQEFQATNIIYPLLTEGIGGFTETLRNRVTIPFDGSYKKFEDVLTHELVHAYINDIDGIIFRNPLFNLNSNYLPFWFAEGLPEYLAVGGKSNYNNMFIIDMMLNDQLADFDNLGGYFAYRLGESILVWISRNWDEHKVVEYFYNIKVMPNLQEATERTFGFDFLELQNRFKISLKRDYMHLLPNYQTPFEFADVRHTYGQKISEYQNIFPTLSPDGKKYVFFSSHKGRTVINEGSTENFTKNKIVMKGETSGKFEEFHFQRNNLSWFPDQRTIAFTAKTSLGDNIYFWDTQRQKITQKIKLHGFKAIYEIDISPDGKQIVLAAQDATSCDLYIYTILTEEIIRITNDDYFNYSPHWSKDGTKIAFVSERDLNEEQETSARFTHLIKNIFYYDVSQKLFYRVTDDCYDNFYPRWVDEQQLLLITEKDEIANIDLINIVQNTRKKITNVFTGVHSFDYSLDNQMLIFSTYYDRSWDIFSKKVSLSLHDDTLATSSTIDSLTYDYATNTPVVFVSDFTTRFNTDEYRLYGRASLPKTSSTKQITQKDSVEVNPFSPPSFGKIGRHNEVPRDSLRIDFIKNLQKNFRLDQRPDSTNYYVPSTRPYRAKFQIDSFWGGFAYSSTFGAIGMLQLGMSDMLGDHGIGTYMEFNGELKASNLVLSYLYLPHRIDYGIAGYNFSNQYLYRFRDPYYNYLEERYFETGGYFLIRYPFSRFFRLDFEQNFYQYKEEIWLIREGYSASGSYIYKEDKAYTKKLNLYVPKIGYVFDNSLYGSTGPLQGQRLTSYIKTSFNPSHKSDFTTIYNDLRVYFSLTHRFSLSHRLIIGSSNGKNYETFNLYGFNGVRGFDNDNLKGNRKTMISTELRYPFIDYLQMPFPLPMTIGNIRGSIFADLGAVWYGNNYRGMRKEQLQDLQMGFGFGPRMNLGFIIVKFDIAWNTNLMHTKKPTYYFTINEDF